MWPARVFSRKEKYDVLGGLIDLAQTLQRVAAAFKDFPSADSRYIWAQDIKTLEHDADQIVHRISKELGDRFILPLDKEDIENIIQLLDDVIDEIEEAANRYNLFGLSETPVGLRKFADLIVDAASLVTDCMKCLSTRGFGSDKYVSSYNAIHSKEDGGDILHRQILKDLFGSGNVSADELRKIICWDKVYQALENALDKCEDLAIAFENIFRKYR